ncbi:hypothetical protein [Herbaspirillum rubrisubalbicans]|nr:hypothetical protein [Herbaspirillum rubrisubalbicans]
MNTMVEMYRGHEIKAGIEESSKAWKISVDVLRGPAFSQSLNT